MIVGSDFLTDPSPLLFIPTIPLAYTRIGGRIVRAVRRVRAQQLNVLGTCVVLDSHGPARQQNPGVGGCVFTTQLVPGYFGSELRAKYFIIDEGDTSNHAQILFDTRGDWPRGLPRLGDYEGDTSNHA